MQQRVTFPGPPCQYISMDPLCRCSGDKLLVGGLDVLVGHLDGALREGAEWYTHLLLGPAQVQGAVDEEHVEVGAHGLGEDLPPHVERLFAPLCRGEEMDRSGSTPKLSFTISPKLLARSTGDLRQDQSKSS